MKPGLVTRAALALGALAVCWVVLDLAARWVFLLWPYPELGAFEARPASALVTDRHGRLLQVTPLDDGLRRLDTAWPDLPPLVRQTFLLSEDRRFYDHGGVDALALLRSAWQNLTGGRVVSGASTVTMQLARLVHPRPPGWVSKIEEMLDAWKLEARLSKDRILTLWLDHLPFSSRLEGVEAAALGVFGAPLADLSPAQCALLAVIPRRPAMYDPRLHPDAAVTAAVRLYPERDELLRAAQASAQTPEFPREAPHYVLHLAAQTPGGLRGRVTTSLDLSLQHRLEAAIRRNLAPWYANRLRTGAGLVLDNATGEVRAWVGSADFDDDAEKGQNDGVLAENQPGSALKPFLYALALERGLTPATVFADVPTDFGSEEVYAPTNFNGRFNGPVRLRVALASSLNVPAVLTLNRVGVKPFESWLERLGFASVARQKGSLGVGLALGNAEVSLQEMVRAFAVFPRGGVDFAGTRVMQPYTAGEIRDILSDQPSRFLGFGQSRTMNTDYDAMFKTGTANQFQHVWALGATPDFTLGVWMGNFRGQTIIGRTGSGIPARTLVEVLDTLAQPSHRWPAVPGSHTVEICTLSGLEAGPDCLSTTRETLPAGTELPPCTWHQPGGVTVYPPEYAAWLGKSGRSGELAALTPAAPEITTPVTGAVYYLDPQKPRSSQAIGVKTRGALAQGLRLWLDGRDLGPLDPTGAFVLPLTPGPHRLELRRGGVTVDVSEYRVLDESGV